MNNQNQISVKDKGFEYLALADCAQNSCSLVSSSQKQANTGSGKFTHLGPTGHAGLTHYCTGPSINYVTRGTKEHG